MAARIKQLLWQPHFVAGTVIFAPICFLGYQMRPASEQDRIQNIRERYGYQQLQETHKRNAAAMDQLFQNRHKSIAELTPGFDLHQKSKMDDTKKQ